MVKYFFDTGVRILCCTSANQCFNLFELSFLSTEKALLAKCGERHNLNHAISLFVIKGFEDVEQLVRSDNPLDGREVLDVSGDEVGIVSGHGNLVEDYILRIEDLIISLNSS